jgi:hypothetical protein
MFGTRTPHSGNIDSEKTDDAASGQGLHININDVKPI